MYKVPFARISKLGRLREKPCPGLVWFDIRTPPYPLSEPPELQKGKSLIKILTTFRSFFSLAFVHFTAGFLSLKQNQVFRKLSLYLNLIYYPVSHLKIIFKECVEKGRGN